VSKVRTILICHHDDRINRLGLAGWVGSFTDLVGLIVIRETKDRLGRRIRANCVGALRYPYLSHHPAARIARP
jgi:hypothetical protein